ncbi:MAG: shikimate kinase [Halothermotrichaceae bacterium]
MIISLIGFMGSGKTAVGKKLADKLAFDFVDIDELIEDKTKMNIADIFEIKGETHFRKIESEVTAKIVHNNDNIVLSTGGGVVLSADNRKLLKSKTRTFLLKTSAEVIYERIKNDATERPLLNCDNPLEKIKKMLKSRAQYYNVFEPRINTDNKSINNIVEEITCILEEDKKRVENRSGRG